MHIIITAATDAELLPAKEVWEAVKIQQDNTISIDCFETGIGTTATAYHTLKAISATSCDLAINIGIAGSLDNSLPIGTVVRPLSDYFGDCGIQTASGFQSLFDALLLNADAFPFASGKLTPPPLSPEWEAALASIPLAHGVTIQRLVGAGLCARPHPQGAFDNVSYIETMEGAAFFYVCMLEKVPCLSLRAISNRAGERDKTKWNIPLSINNLRHTLKSLLYNN